LILVILLIVLFANTEPFSTVILKRFETFSNIAEDGSGLERVEQLNRATSALMSEFIGYGNNGQEELSRANNYLLSGYDMGLYQYLACYGWIGSLVYGTGILLIIIKLCQNFPGKSDMFAVSARAIVFACIARVMTSSLLLYEFALPLWLFVGISMAAVKYHSNVQGSKLDISS
jgi:hypothetical protein